MRHILFLFVTFHSAYAFSCTCSFIRDLKTEQMESFADHNLIFLAEPLGPGDEEGTYNLKVLEILKGNYSDSVIIGKYYNSCSQYPRIEDKMWLVYTNHDREDGPIDISDCGLSRSIRFPFLLTDKQTDASLPPPPRNVDYEKNESDWNLQWEIDFTEGKRKALILLQKEIQMIRKKYK
ncbi:hypothetical protein [Ekhidna sp.]